MRWSGRESRRVCDHISHFKDLLILLSSLSLPPQVKFDTFVAQGRVLHNYASILEMLLRLRQTCDHPFLVLSRGDTLDYADLNKLGRSFLTTCPNTRPTNTQAQGEALVQACAPIMSTGTAWSTVASGDGYCRHVQILAIGTVDSDHLVRTPTAIL